MICNRTTENWHPDSGIWWKTDNRSKNACVNGLCQNFCRENRGCPVGQFCETSGGSCGARPNRVGLYSWAIGASLAATGGILIAPALSLDPGSLSLLIVNAYAAAIFGRLRSLPMTRGSSS